MTNYNKIKLLKQIIYSLLVVEITIILGILLGAWLYGV